MEKYYIAISYDAQEVGINADSYESLKDLKNDGWNYYIEVAVDDSQKNRSLKCLGKIAIKP